MDPQEARIFIAIIITAIVLGVIIGFFAVSIIRQQRRNLALQKANILAEINAMEKERARIAEDLHDDLGPILSVIKFQVDHAGQSERVEKENLGKASQHLDNLISRMREIANDLIPIALQRKGLIVALEEYISSVRDSSPLRIHFSYPDSLQLPPQKAIHIYRILQELIHNCIKHANAKNLTIDISQQSNLLRILCRDDGKGFDHSRSIRDGRGLGLSSINNRAEITGGTVTVESKPEKGTAFLFDIPVP